MSERAVAELIVHLGRITPRGRLRRGPDAGAMDRATLLWARQPLLPDALRLRGISWHDPWHGFAGERSKPPFGSCTSCEHLESDGSYWERKLPYQCGWSARRWRRRNSNSSALISRRVGTRR